ncbi:hypothetical protein, partial [Frankia sp. AgKG'84/4]
MSGTNLLTTPIPPGKVVTGSADITSGNDSALVSSFGPDGLGNWVVRILTNSGGGTAQTTLFVIDAPTP